MEKVGNKYTNITNQENKFLPTWIYWVYGVLLFLPVFTGINKLITLIPGLTGPFLLFFTYKRKTNKLMDRSIKFGIIPIILLYSYIIAAIVLEDVLKIQLGGEGVNIYVILGVIIVILVIISTISLIIGLFKSKVSRV